MGSLYQTLPQVAALIFVLTTAGAARRPRIDWRLPLVVSVLFLGWSLYTMISEGPIGFWAEHTRNAWGNQIWFDLLIAIAIAWSLILPRALAVGMQVWSWLILVTATGCIGLSAMYARCLYLESRTA